MTMQNQLLILQHNKQHIHYLLTDYTNLWHYAFGSYIDLIAQDHLHSSDRISCALSNLNLYSKDIILSLNCHSQLPVSLLNLQNPAELWNAM